jgi:TolB-like protein
VSATDDAGRPARSDFRIQTRRRGGYEGAVMHDIQLIVSATGAMVWAQTFTDEDQADAFLAQIEDHLAHMDSREFRSRYSVPSSM